MFYFSMKNGHHKKEDMNFFYHDDHTTKINVAANHLVIVKQTHPLHSLKRGNYNVIIKTFITRNHLNLISTSTANIIVFNKITRFT
jgi:hypothetical protein